MCAPNNRPLGLISFNLENSTIRMEDATNADIATGSVPAASAWPSLRGRESAEVFMHNAQAAAFQSGGEKDA